MVIIQGHKNGSFLGLILFGLIGSHSVQTAVMINIVPVVHYTFLHYGGKIYVFFLFCFFKGKQVKHAKHFLAM